jgi:hypothetical protein
MITIVDKEGKNKIVCTKGTFEEQYKILGYRIASEKEEATKKVASIVKKEEIKQDNEEEKINEKYGLKKTEKKGK